MAQDGMFYILSEAEAGQFAFGSTASFMPALVADQEQLSLCSWAFRQPLYKNTYEWALNSNHNQGGTHG